MTCTHCTAPTADGIYLCDTAEGDLFALLGKLGFRHVAGLLLQRQMMQRVA